MRCGVLIVMITAICALWSQEFRALHPLPTDPTPTLPGVISDFDAGTLAAACASAVDTRISGKNPATDRDQWQTYDPQTPAYERSPTFWAADLDVTCKCAWNSSNGSQLAVTLITPRHALMVAHSPFANLTDVHFVGADNQLHIATIIEQSAVSPGVSDLAVCVFDSDVPEFITPCSMLPGNVESYLPQVPWFITEPRVPCLRLNQFQQGAVDAAITFIPPVAVLSQWRKTGDDADRKAFWRAIELGDSGCPAFFILNDQCVLAGITRGSVQLNFAGGYSSAINAAIAAADTAAGINTGYTVTAADLSAFPTL